MESEKAFVALILSALLLLTAPARPALAQAPGDGSLRVTLPLDLIDTLDGAKFKIRVPANWNGTLLVYLQGLRMGPPPPEPSLTPPVLPGSEPRLEETLLSLGYGLAASEIANTDVQVKESVEDHFALTSYIRGRVGAPKRVILWGASNGGLSALRLIEEYPRAFDAAIATCAPAAGMSRNQDRRLDFALAYAVVFGWPDAWGPLEDTRPGLNFATDVNPRVQWPKPDGSNRGGWEFIRLVNGLGSEEFWKTDPMWGFTGFLINMLWATQTRESTEAWAAGPVAQNLDRRYALKPEEKSYLAGLGVNADDLLAKMNSRTNIAACPWGRDYVVRFGDVRGTLRRPVITLHTTADSLADIRNESAYRAAVQWWGREKYLTQAYVNAVGHCAFTSKQLLSALAAMERWLDSGVQPDASVFSGAEGFDNRFVPPPWPY